MAEKQRAMMLWARSTGSMITPVVLPLLGSSTHSRESSLRTFARKRFATRRCWTVSLPACLHPLQSEVAFSSFPSGKVDMAAAAAKGPGKVEVDMAPCTRLGV